MRQAAVHVHGPLCPLATATGTGTARAIRRTALKLFHMDGFDAKTGAVGKAKNITDANLADYVAMETAAGTLTSTVEDAKRTLQTRVTKTEQNYPTNAAGYSDAS